MESEKKLNEEQTVELTDQEAEQAAGGLTIDIVSPSTRMMYTCLTPGCGWKIVCRLSEAPNACPKCNGSLRWETLSLGSC